MRKVDNICVVESLKGSSVMPAVHIHNFDSIAAEEIMHIKPVYIYREIYVHMFLVCAQIRTHITYMNKNEAHTYLVALKNCPFGCHVNVAS